MEQFNEVVRDDIAGERMWRVRGANLDEQCLARITIGDAGRFKRVLNLAENALHLLQRTANRLGDVCQCEVIDIKRAVLLDYRVVLMIFLIHNFPTIRRSASDACGFCEARFVWQVFLQNGVQRFRKHPFLQRFFELQRNLKQFEPQAAIVVQIAENLLSDGDFGFGEVGKPQLFLQKLVQGADLGDFGQLGFGVDASCGAPFADVESVIKGEIQVNVNSGIFLVNVLL